MTSMLAEKQDLKIYTNALRGRLQEGGLQTKYEAIV
jgi:hypothetical protein